jgi:hypothetical protein
MTARVIAFVEGQTEEKFIREIVAPALMARDIAITATTPGRKRSVGGVQPWTRVIRELLRFLKEDTNRHVTTMFDYYGLPTDWPGSDDAPHLGHSQKALTVENAMLSEISGAMGNAFDVQRFIPYVQMHEFEALLFSSPEILGKIIPEQDIANDLQSIADSFQTPEEINDDPHSAPSKRILRLSQRQYQKVLHGNIAAKEIGLSLMRQECPHFREWLSRLESLGQES